MGGSHVSTTTSDLPRNSIRFQGPKHVFLTTASTLTSPWDRQLTATFRGLMTKPIHLYYNCDFSDGVHTSHVPTTTSDLPRKFIRFQGPKHAFLTTASTLTSPWDRRLTATFRRLMTKPIHLYYNCDFTVRMHRSHASTTFGDLPRK